MFFGNMNRALMMAGIRLGIPEALPSPRVGDSRRPRLVKRGYYEECTTYFPPKKRNGTRERERRLRQISEGRLRAENGLA